MEVFLKLHFARAQHAAKAHRRARARCSHAPLVPRAAGRIPNHQAERSPLGGDGYVVGTGISDD
jgi:hypothetical protein